MTEKRLATNCLTIITTSLPEGRRKIFYIGGEFDLKSRGGVNLTGLTRNLNINH